MTSQTVMKFCQDNSIDRIVINTGLPNMFVLERNRENLKERVIKEDTTVQIGTPKRPISSLIASKLITNFKNDTTIAEVYQYGQSMGGEFSIVLAFKLTINSENAKKAAIFAVQNALQTDTLDQPLDLYFIEAEDVYERIKRINNSLLYKQNGPMI